MYKRQVLRRTIIVLLTLFCAQTIYGQEWWEQAKQEQESSTRYTMSGDIQGNNVRAVADFENQFLEFEATGTVDMRETVNEVQAEINAKEAATVRAYAEAARFISGMLVQAVYSVRQGLLKDADIAAKIEKTLVKHAVEIEEPKVEWRRSAPLATAKIGILFQNRNGLIETVLPYIDQGVENAGITNYSASGNDRGSAERYTGVIIDTRELEVSPSIAPMVLTGEDNQQVYGNLTVSREFAVMRGIAGYYRDMEAAKADTDRIGDKPLIIKAEKTAMNNHHVWINKDDATKLYYANQNNDFLKECRVAIVLK